MAGVRFSAMLFLLILLITMSMLAKQLLADNQGATTTSTYKSTTIERSTTVREEVKVVQPLPKKEKLTCALIVKNRAPRVADEKVVVLQDFIVGRVTDAGFTLISRENVANAVSAFADDGPNRGQGKESLDKALSDNTSAMQLARNLNADCILSAAISSYGADTVHYTGHNLDVTGTQYRLKVSFELVDAYRGGSITGGVVTVSFSDRQQAGLTAKRENVLDDLLDAAANDLSNMLATSMADGKLTEAVAAARADSKLVSFKVNLTVANLSIPQVVKDDKGQYLLGEPWQAVQAGPAAVELDGVVIGTTPGPLQASPGLHKMRLRRETMKDWTGTVFIRDGQELSLAMQLSDDGWKRLGDMSSFFTNLKQGQIITQATADRIEGYATMLRQSGYQLNATTLPSLKTLPKLPSDNESPDTIIIKTAPKSDQ